MTRDEQPRSTVEQLIRRFLPRGCHRFLIGQSEELRLADVILRALFGALSGAAMFAVIAPGLPPHLNHWLTFDLKLATGCLFTGACLLGGATSSAFRCAVLLMLPNMLGSRGRTFITLLVISELYSGPVSNMRENVKMAAESLTCNLELQVRNAKLLWRDAVTPFHRVAQEVQAGEADLKSEAGGASKAFADIQNQILNKYKLGPLPDGNAGTQEQFAFNTIAQCDKIVDKGVAKCREWFGDKWNECAKVIGVPVIKHILCVPMKFHFLCDIIRVMTGWCKQHIPVEQNFGQLFNRVKSSVELLTRQFTSTLVFKERERQSGLGGELASGNLTRGIQDSFRQLDGGARRLLDILRLLPSLAFLSVFAQCLGYVRRFRGDVYFDNFYLTKYFAIIDRRRKSQGKRHLLPLTPSERQKFVDPWSLKIHAEEVRQVLSSVFQVLSVLLLAVALLALDGSVFRVLDVVSKHTHATFNFSSSQEVDVQVGGTSMMARLLRKSLSAFNTSSSVRMVSDNRGCVTPPTSLAALEYVSISSYLLLAALFSGLQVYANRLRRVITAFYHPRREKTRILFLYNVSLYRRMSCQPAPAHHARVNVLECLSRLCQRRREAPGSDVQRV
ncbi:DC-STAMP domain-containing protein 1 [Vanacampus margaritifer]